MTTSTASTWPKFRKRGCAALPDHMRWRWRKETSCSSPAIALSAAITYHAAAGEVGIVTAASTAMATAWAAMKLLWSACFE